MNLVDILARELKEWPCDGHTIHQGVEGNIFAILHGMPNRKVQLADDWLTAEVTRAQWQAAVDALKAGEQAWDGKGMPPVGLTVETVCGGCVVEILCVTERSVFMREPSRNAEWVWSRENPGSRTFRPIRTAEQIAAEERAAEVDAMLALDTYPKGELAGGLMSRRSFCEALIAAGYRKQVQP